MHIYSIKCYAKTQRFLVLRENYFKDLIHVYKLNRTQFQHVTYTIRTRYATRYAFQHIRMYRKLTRYTRYA